MHTTEYLYGIQSSEFANLPYTEAIRYKLDKAKILIYELVYHDYRTRDDLRILKIGKAIKFNNQLLEELT